MADGTGWKCEKPAGEECSFPPIAKSAMDGAPGRLCWFGEKSRFLRYAAEWKCKEGAEWKYKRAWNGNATRARNGNAKFGYSLVPAFLSKSMPKRVRSTTMQKMCSRARWDSWMFIVTFEGMMTM